MLESHQRMAGHATTERARTMIMKTDPLESPHLSASFKRVPLPGGHSMVVGSLPNHLQPSPDQFSALWEMHPLDYHEIKMHGRGWSRRRDGSRPSVTTAYTGRVNRALPIPTILEPLVSWAREGVDTRLNGILVNWYDSALGHYIGRHRDSIIGLAERSPIVTISLGAERRFRLRPWPSKLGGPPLDLPATDGAVFVMPWSTNRAFTHEVPTGRASSGRRISVTLRAFSDARGEEQNHEWVGAKLGDDS